MRLKRVVFGRVATLVISVTIFIAASFAIFAVQYNRHQAKRALTDQALLMSGGIQRLLLWDDRVTIERRLSELVDRDDRLSYAFVTRGDQPLASTFPGGVPEGLLRLGDDLGEGPRIVDFRDHNGEVLTDVAVPLTSPGDRVHLGLSRKEVDRALIPLLQAIAGMVLAAVCGGVLLAFVLARQSVREVEILTEVVHGWTEGRELAGKAREHFSQEVADLATDFESLIADRKMAEAKASQQHAFLNNVFDALTHPLYVINVEDYTIEMANPAAQAQGINRGVACYTATHGRWTPCDGTDHPCPLTMVRETGSAAHVRHTHFDMDGSPRSLEIHGFPVRDEEGRIVRMIEYSLDVTDRVSAEMELRLRNRELALLNWVIGASATGVEEQEIFSTTCTELAKCLGVDRVAVVMNNENRTSTRVVAEHLEGDLPPMLGLVFDSAAFGALFDDLANHKVIASRQVDIDTRFEGISEDLARCGVGSLVLVPLTVDSRVVGVVLLTEERRTVFPAEDVELAVSVSGQLSSSLARARINATRKRLQTVIEQTENSVYITGLNGQVDYVNPAFERVTGYQASEVLGRTTAFLESGVHEGDFLKNVRDTITSGRVWRGRLTSRSKSGALFTEDSVVTPVKAEEGSISCFVSVSRDVTREIELEEQFLQAQKLEGIGRLAGGIAHDFNNLLGAIMGYAELGLAQVEKGSGLHDLLGEMVTASEHAAKLIKQLLLFSRSQPSEISLVSVNDLIRGVENVFQRMIGEEIAIETNLEVELPQIEANPSQFEQVLLNLVVNAADAMPEGGSIFIKTSEARLDEVAGGHLGDVRPGRYVVLEVSDTGTGMSPEIREQIFEPFFSTKERSQGSGLGLSTCYGIVTQAGGHITVDTEEGRGTSIGVYLPAYRPVPPFVAVQEEGEQKSGTRGSETILIAEDDKAVRTVAADALRAIGYEVLEADDGEMALRRAESHNGPIDVLVTDVVMPRLRGPDLAAALRGTRPDMKVIFITGYGEDRLSSEELGGGELVEKPFQPHALAARIRVTLDS